MNRLSTSQNELLAAYIYASQQLLIANKFEERLPEAFARLGSALDTSRINVYRQEYLDDGKIQMWHEYSWRSYNAALLSHIPGEQGIIHQQNRTTHWDNIISEDGHIQGIATDFPLTERPFFETNHLLSILIVPIYVNEDRWGIIGFDDCERERIWSDVEIDILKGLAGVMGTAIANGRLYQAEQKARQRAELIRDLSRLIGKNMSRTAIVQCILQELKQIITFDTSSIYLVPQGGEPELITVSGFSDQETTMREAKRLLKDSPILHKMSQNLQSIISPDVRDLDGWIWVPGGTDVRSFMAAPMVYHQKMIGTLMLDSTEVDFFQENDLHMIETLAQQIAITLENARLLESAQQEARQKTAILEASTAVSSSLSFDAILTELAKQLCQGIDATSAYIIQLYRETKTAVIVAEYISPQPPAHKFISSLNYTYKFPDDYIGDITWLEKGIPYIRHIDTPNMSETLKAHMRQYGGKSIISLPLSIKGQIFGYAQIWQSQHRRPFTKQQVALCVGIAQQAAIAFEHSTLFAEQKRQLQFFNTLQQVGSLLTASLTLEQVYERIFDLLAQVVDYDNVSLQLIDENEKEAHFATGRGYDRVDIVQEFVDSIGQHAIKKVIKPPYWAIINDTRADPNWIVGSESLDETRSWIGAALIVKERIIGILNIGHHAPHAYNPEIGETVAVFANQAAIAVENNRLYREVEQGISELTILHRVAQATATIVDQDELLRLTTEMIVEAMPYEFFGTAFLSEEDPGFLIPHQSTHGFPVDPQTVRLPMDASVVGLAAKTMQPVCVTDTSKEALHYAVQGAITGTEIAVPIIISGKVAAVIYVGRTKVGMLDEEDVRFLTTLAGQLSAAMERARLYKGLQQQTTMLAQQVAHRTAELQSERDRTIAILENAGESIIISDTDSLISYVNPAMELLSGYSRHELLGQHPRLWRDPLTKKTIYDEMRQRLKNGRSWQGEVVNVRKDGSKYDVLMNITPLMENDKIVGYVSMQADISRLKELDRLKSKFVSNVSHELRTPLTNIKTYLTLLERGKPEKRPRYMEIMHQEVDRLARLLQDLLDLSRLEAAPLPAYLAPIDFITTIRQHFTVFSVRAQAKKIQYEIDLPDIALPVKITADHGGQLLTNLIGNALAYTPENGRVTLIANETVKNNSHYICVRIEDDGIGIDPQDMPHIFERFYRGEGKHTSNIPGTGLGLAICNEIIERYNGSISVESTLGKGTVITFWLPIAPTANNK